MYIKQISIFVENKSGRLAEVTKIIAENNINIHALSIADTSDFGILRLIVDKPDEAKKALKEKGLTVKTTEVVAISVRHVPGGLAEVLKILVEERISIEYMYAFTGKNHDSDAKVILRLDDQEKAISILKEKNIPILNNDNLIERNTL